jgi:hypothetical protein
MRRYMRKVEVRERGKKMLRFEMECACSEGEDDEILHQSNRGRTLTLHRGERRRPRAGRRRP